MKTTLREWRRIREICKKVLHNGKSKAVYVREFEERKKVENQSSNASI